MKGPQHQQPRGIELGRHVGDQLLNELMAADFLAPLFPVLHVGYGGLEGRPSDAGSDRGDEAASPFEKPKRGTQAGSGLPETPAGRHEHVIEHELRRRPVVQPELRKLA
jgi:hypothetical protein